MSVRDGERESKNKGEKMIRKKKKTRRERRCEMLPRFDYKEYEGKHMIIIFRCLHSQEPFNLPNCPGGIEAHTGHGRCPKITLLPSGRTMTEAVLSPQRKAALMWIITDYTSGCLLRATRRRSASHSSPIWCSERPGTRITILPTSLMRTQM